MNSKKNKSIARKKYQGIRKEVVNVKENLIYNQVKRKLNQLLIKKKNLCIGIYWPLSGEVNLTKLKGSAKLFLALPASKILNEITYHLWRENPLEDDLLGIPAPISEPILPPSKLDLLLVPALAIDQSGHRLGYGGGYFDRLRSKAPWRAVKSLVVLPEACVSKQALPVDQWDIPFDGWITEEGCFEIREVNKKS
ncbi:MULTISPECIES: 5-formyltetrahydrofolate cyclo-ligase [Prochlorococcus]|uniref:5-formyltetrahydrofolate cyclo-ligase n=1 Tax=Prochlorococcus TaxID=1218 RepID=UPI000533A27B|nr:MULTISPECIES: 5-formyltetrahydrofolate cyclo-ligase [Prochlorococcus]KGG12212.1 5-formyltetrahydrofolate cyclo-ligase [Prochlorococcus sp. MIT 0601]